MSTSIIYILPSQNVCRTLENADIMQAIYYRFPHSKFEEKEYGTNSCVQYHWWSVLQLLSATTSVNNHASMFNEGPKKTSARTMRRELSEMSFKEFHLHQEATGQ